MRWFKPNLRNSLHAIFSAGLGQARPEEAESAFTIEDIRQRMLQLVPPDTDGDERTAVVARRLRYADQVESLWFMRGELMAVLARTRGEAAALEAISGVSDMFDNLLPEGLRSRPSPLGKS
ncbi:hypothetical protein [Ramlibacter humi]|uniref:Uncharacterized protein n=1 Tax=Ramlibacter humi TaxID=2530451 RepID=A0A4Z0CDI1_9BURK|nr:hypothetical protein [Ramlibacter humi]TFZ08269.1 hypothetical protein EZ216_03660 [Ramlibacter humi]